MSVIAERRKENIQKSSTKAVETNFIKRLNIILGKKGYKPTSPQISDKINIQASYSQWKNKGVLPILSTVVTLAKALDVDPINLRYGTVVNLESILANKVPDSLLYFISKGTYDKNYKLLTKKELEIILRRLGLYENRVESKRETFKVISARMGLKSNDSPSKIYEKAMKKIDALWVSDGKLEMIDRNEIQSKIDEAKARKREEERIALHFKTGKAPSQERELTIEEARNFGKPKSENTDSVKLDKNLKFVKEQVEDVIAKLTMSISEIPDAMDIELIEKKIKLNKKLYKQVKLLNKLSI